MGFEPTGYLATEVFTAPPQRLQLLLIEGAIRYLHKTKALWEQGKIEKGYEFLAQARAIIAEILGGLRKDILPEVTRRVAAVYTFLYTRLVEARARQDIQKLDEIIRVLEIERETWSEVCRRLAEESSSQIDSLAVVESSQELPTSSPQLCSWKDDSPSDFPPETLRFVAEA